MLFRIVRLEKIKLSRKTFLLGLFSTEEILFLEGERGGGKKGWSIKTKKSWWRSVCGGCIFVLFLSLFLKKHFCYEQTLARPLYYVFPRIRHCLTYEGETSKWERLGHKPEANALDKAGCVLKTWQVRNCTGRWAQNTCRSYHLTFNIFTALFKMSRHIPKPRGYKWVSSLFCGYNKGWEITNFCLVD